MVDLNTELIIVQWWWRWWENK